jgi:hypothetical protein
MAVNVSGEFPVPIGGLPYRHLSGHWRDWILRGIHPKLRPPEERLRPKAGHIIVFDRKKGTMKMKPRTITIKGKGASDDGGSESRSESGREASEGDAGRGGGELSPAGSEGAEAGEA